MKQHVPQGLAQEFSAAKHAWKKIQDIFFQVLDTNHMQCNQDLCCVWTTGAHQIHLLLLCLSLRAGNVYYEVNFRLSSLLEACLPNTIHHTVLYETRKGIQKHETWMSPITEEVIRWSFLRNLIFRKSLILTCKGTKVTKVSYHTE